MIPIPNYGLGLAEPIETAVPPDSGEGPPLSIKKRHPRSKLPAHNPYEAHPAPQIENSVAPQARRPAFEIRTPATSE